MKDIRTLARELREALLAGDQDGACKVFHAIQVWSLYNPQSDPHEVPGLIAAVSDFREQVEPTDKRIQIADPDEYIEGIHRALDEEELEAAYRIMTVLRASWKSGGPRPSKVGELLFSAAVMRRDW